MLKWSHIRGEANMRRVIQIILGFVVGIVGLVHFVDNPTLCCSTLLMSGFIMLDGST
jgi:hypothetical protein